MNVELLALTPTTEQRAKMAYVYIRQSSILMVDEKEAASPCGAPSVSYRSRLSAALRQARPLTPSFPPCTALTRHDQWMVTRPEGTRQRVAADGRQAPQRASLTVGRKGRGTVWAAPAGRASWPPRRGSRLIGFGLEDESLCGVAVSP